MFTSEKNQNILFFQNILFYYYTSFYNLQSKPSAMKKGRPLNSSSQKFDQPFEDVLNLMKNDSTKAYSSHQLYNCYLDFGGTLENKQFSINLLDYFGDELILLNSPGVCNMYI